MWESYRFRECTEAAGRSVMRGHLHWHRLDSIKFAQKIQWERKMQVRPNYQWINTGNKLVNKTTKRQSHSSRSHGWKLKPRKPPLDWGMRSWWWLRSWFLSSVCTPSSTWTSALKSTSTWMWTSTTWTGIRPNVLSLSLVFPVTTVNGPIYDQMNWEQPETTLVTTWPFILGQLLLTILECGCFFSWMQKCFVVYSIHAVIWSAIIWTVQSRKVKKSVFHAVSLRTIVFCPLCLLLHSCPLFGKYKIIFILHSNHVLPT